MSRACSRRAVRALALPVALLGALFLAACSSSDADTAPTSTATALAAAASPTSIATTPPEPTATPEPEPTATPEPEPEPTAPPAPAPTQPSAPAPPPPTTAPVQPAPSGPVSRAVVADTLTFSPRSVQVPSNTQVTIVMNNTDQLVAHDIQILDRGTTGLCTGPCTGTMTFNSGAPGTYAMLCSVHPTMRGTLIVQ